MFNSQARKATKAARAADLKAQYEAAKAADEAALAANKEATRKVEATRYASSGAIYGYRVVADTAEGTTLEHMRDQQAEAEELAEHLTQTFGHACGVCPLRIRTKEDEAAYQQARDERTAAAEHYRLTHLAYSLSRVKAVR